MKKVLVYLLTIVLLVVAGFLSIGFFVPAVEYSTTVEINKPREFTWKILRERKDWVYGFKSIEQISGKPDEIGSRARLSVVRDGVEYTFDSELIDIKAPEMAVTELNNDLLVHDARIQLFESDGKTKVISTEKIIAKNPFLRSVFVFLKGRFTTVSAKNFEGLKQVVEAAQ